MKENTKTLIKNYTIYIICLLAFNIISYFLFKIPYIDMELLEVDNSFLFGSRTYEVNPYIYYIAPLLFSVVFLSVWFGILKGNLGKIRQITKIGYWIGLVLFVIFLAIEYCIYIFSMLTTFGLTGIELKNGHILVDFIPFIFMFVTVLISTIYTLKRGIK